jgi:hypothetical protein
LRLVALDALTSKPREVFHAPLRVLLQRLQETFSKILTIAEHDKQPVFPLAIQGIK